MLALAALAVLIAAIWIRTACAFKVMREYQPDEILANPRARRLWMTAHVMGPVATLPIIFAASLAHLWWVTTAAAIFALLIVYKSGWAVWSRYRSA